MLKSLQIKDYALIENVFIEFGRGLNIITGETGAGKSILIDALGVILGERASLEVIRKGASKTIVEAMFDVSNHRRIKSLLEENDIEFHDELILRREISLKSSNRCFINDTPVTLNLLKEAGELLVDLHGQHEHQSLLKNEHHIDFLDQYVDVADDLEKFNLARKKLSSVIQHYEKILSEKKFFVEKRDVYSFQIKEIDAIAPEENEDITLEEELTKLENAEQIISLSNECYEMLFDQENAVYDRLVDVQNKLADLARLDKYFGELSGEADSAQVIIKELALSLRDYKLNLDLDSEKLNSLRSRLNSITHLKKRYGNGSLKNLLEHRKKIGDEFDLIENFEDKISEYKKEISKLRDECGLIALSISEKRKKVVKKVKQEVENTLKNLGIADGIFEINFSLNESDDQTNSIPVNGKNYLFNSKGIDNVKFLISTNLGEDPKPLVKVASGGEVSRVMLSLKSVLAKSDKLPILIFDEIDTGVSGRIAQKVGQALKNLSSTHQIIAITHLPQIASLSDYHYSVEKLKIDDRVVSNIRALNQSEKINEIAKLISGEKITDSAIISAKELLGIN